MASRFRAVVALVALTAGLTACFTGERPHLVERPVTTGDAAADAVLDRLDRATEATFSADYTILTRFGGIETPATVVVDGRAHSGVTIGDVRYVVDESAASTCRLDGSACSEGADASLVSDLQVTPGFYGPSPASRLRTDVERRVGPTVASTDIIAAQEATCVAVPLTGATTTYCALASGPLALLDGADLQITMTSYTPTADPSGLTGPG